jgi:hypothetical protein
MTDNFPLGTIVGAGVTLMIADRFLNPHYKVRYRTRKRRKKK